MSELTIICRTPDEVQHLSGPTDVAVKAATKLEAKSISFSPDAKLTVVGTAEGLLLQDTASGTEVRSIQAPGVQATAFSPSAAFLVTYQRPSKDAQGGQDKNLKVWRVADGECVLALHQKTYSRDTWPTVQFNADESLAFHQVTNAVNMYNPAAFDAGVAKRLPLKGVAGFAACPAPDSTLIVAYVAEAKGQPGFIALYDHSTVGPSGDTPPPLCRKSFYRANQARLMWNSTGTACLALTSADVDATNQSYYGEQKLYWLAADGSGEQAVPLPKDGPIHDVQWTSQGDYFLTVAGFMPAKVTLFTERCVAKYDLGSGPYSQARWNPWGRFLAVAGFGNLPGDIALFDKKADGKCKPMGNTRAENGVTLEWSPEGRHLLVATTAPRLRVDNGIQVFKYDGTLVARERREVLLEAQWVPAAPGAYEDRPQSPRAAGAAGASSSSNSAAALPQPAARAAGYVPPHLRGRPEAAAAARAAFSLARDPNDKGGKIGGSGSSSSSTAANLPPGAAPPPSKAASKNAKRRAAAAKKKAEEGVAGLQI